jgi:transcriptional regulator GlxA family with amidase domain
VKEVIVSFVMGKPARFLQVAPRPHGSVSIGNTEHNRGPASVKAGGGATVLELTPRVKGGLPPRALRRVRDYIDVHLAERFSNATLAAIAEVSTSHFVRAFKQSEGLTPHRYVIRRRVEHAKELLASTNLPLAEIAMTVGFADQSHCARCFREHVGVRPRDYRWSTR